MRLRCRAEHGKAAERDKPLWRDTGLFEAMNHLLVMADRERAGREASHSAAPTFHGCSGDATIQAARGETDMAKGEQRGNREAKKPKKEKPKESAAAPSTKGTVASIASSKK